MEPPSQHFFISGSILSVAKGVFHSLLVTPANVCADGYPVKPGMTSTLRVCAQEMGMAAQID
jgi:hypothetical protein